METKKVSELINNLKELENNYGTEEGHMIADKILCDIIAEYGHSEVREIFNKIPKWYA